jgi:EEF1A lysine methyltransferase 1
VFIVLKNILASPPYVNGPGSKPGICLLEYDRRFEVLCDGERAGIGAGAGAGVGEGEGEFVHYDFEYALRLPGWLRGWADRVVVDPPFLSDQCQAAVAETVGWLLKSKTEAGDRPSKTEAAEERGEDMEAPKIIVCTGAIMADLVLELYSDAGRGVQMRRTGFEAVHEGGRLSNEWGTFANFEGEEWRLVD